MALIPQHLLLLPPPPWPATAETVQAAYKDALTAVLKQLTFDTRSSTPGATLDIALPFPYAFEHLSLPRVSVYEPTQALVANVYKLICLIAAREKINVEDAEGIDVRIFIVARPRHDDAPEGASLPSGRGSLFGPVIDMPTLARCGRPWQKVFAVQSEHGEKVLNQFLRHQDGRVKTQSVAGGIVQVNSSEAGGDLTADEAAHHTSIAVGGTWDHIHIGHKLLLTMFAFLLKPDNGGEEPRSLTVGITGDELLVNKKFAECLESWDERKNSALSFLRAIMDFRPDAEVKTTELNEPGPNGHAVHAVLGSNLTFKLVEIGDPFGPTITDESISALVLSAETRAGGKAVNDKREEKGWPALQVLEVDVLDAGEAQQGGNNSDSFESKLSSTDIREAISKRAKIRSKA
ncbi:hypothetical protein FH972_021372 [Carpinus fangiana]|uniref:Cytidyltransferase-like domain-containing protein n=1 Tax=Carpinus fangiana TaxID=176857 RepID=A0A5N6KP62_9ROSI|nr:hypothetical protein FH972_021372 [Carpinus fangiana]